MALRTDQTDALATLGNHAADHVATNTAVNANGAAITALQAANTGTNTGDETTATIKSKLGVSTLSGSNTGDETLATIKSKLGVTTLSGSNTGDQDLSSYATTSSVTTGLAAKQATLVSGTNIKTVNGSTLLGSGDLTVAAGSSITVKDEGSTLTSAPTSLDFVGTGVTATNTGGAVTVTVPDNSTTKEPAVSAGTTAQYYRGDKTFQTLNQDAVPSGTTNKAYTATEQTKLSGIATAATANSTDATLLARANHTGTQLAATISDFSTAADARITAAGKAPLASPTFTGSVTTPALKVTGGTPGTGKVLTDDGTGTGVAVWTTPSGGGASDATTLAKGIVQLAGDLAGTAASPTVPGLTGKLDTTGGTLTGTLTTRIVQPDGDATRELGNSGFGWNRLWSYRWQINASTAIENNGTNSARLTGSFVPSGGTFDLGGSASYWGNVYAARHYLNSTAYLDGATAGVINTTGDLRVGTAGTNAASVATVGGTQTLTGKTIDGGSNTLSNVPVTGIAATGTPSSSTYLRGDGTWSAASGGGSGTPAGASGEVQFNASGAFGSSGNLTWDDANNHLGVGFVPSAVATTQGLSAYNSSAFQLMPVAIGSSAASGVAGYHARGTAVTQTASQSGDTIGSYTARGYGATGWSFGSNAGVFVKAAENMTDTAHGAYVTVEATAATTATRAEVHRFLSASASAVNYLQSTNSVTTAPVVLSAQGTDSNIGINLTPKGTGTVQAGGVAVVTATGTQTLTNKTLTTPVISSISNTGTVTLPTATDTLVGRATTDTLTNKRISKRIEALADAATVTPASDTNDGGKVTELSQTTVFANPTGTPTDMQQYVLRIKSTTARAISFGTAYRAINVTLPTTTVAGKLTYIAMQWEAGASKWDVLYVGQEA